MTNIDCDVVIVGAGPAGATLACNLRYSGLKVVIVEKYKKTPAISRGDHLGPCTVKMLDKIGVLDNLFERGAIRVTRWKAIGPEGETLADFPIDIVATPPYDYIISLQHTTLRDTLIEAALESDSVSFLNGFQATDLIRDDTGFIKGVQGEKDGENYTINASLVAACDGIRSSIRELAGINTELQTSTDEFVMFTYELGSSVPRGTNIEVWGAEGFVGYFPLPDGKIRCPVQAERGALTRWRQQGLKKTHEDLAARYPYFSDMKPLDQDLYVYKVVQHHADTYVADGLVLIGDSAHGTTPFFGMGMTLGMRDGYHLAKMVTDLFKQGRKADRNSLQAYEAKCRNYNDFVINASANLSLVGASRLKTASEIQGALMKHTALDADVMSVIYADYDAPPPQHTDPRKVSRYVASVQNATMLSPELLLDGLGFAESPRWHAGRLWFVDFFSGAVLSVDADGALEEVVKLSATPSGLGFLPDDSLVVGSQNDYKILRLDEAGKLHEYADLRQYMRGGLNDMTVDAAGNIYVGHFGFDFLGGGDPVDASLLHVNPQGQISEVADGLVLPNGIVITPDGKTLIVAETFRAQLTAYDIQADGGLSKRRVWAELPGYTPDGICIDEEGAIWAGSPLVNAFIRVKEGGEITHRVPVDGKWAVACALGGPDRRTLFCITAQTSLADMPKGISKGYIEVVKVDIPGVAVP